MLFGGITACTPTHPVTVRGRSIFGKRSSLTFSPCADRVSALYWRYQHQRGSSLIPVTSSCAEYRPRRIALSYNAHSLEIIEHVSVLRFLGLSHTILESNGSAWPPYFGRAWEFWEVLQGAISESNTLIQWCTVPQAIRVEHQHALGGYTEWLPGKERTLTIKLTVRYPSHQSQKHLECELPRDHWMLLEALKSYTPGKPEWLRPLSALGSALGLWQHHQHVEWMREETLASSLNSFALHRLCDLLGGFALAHPTRLPAGTITSVYGGHKSDLELLSKVPARTLICL